MAPQDGQATSTPSNGEVVGNESAPRRIKFTINSISYTVGADVSPRTTLLDFIRDTVQAKGTKVLCREGGCGACTVVVTIPDQENIVDKPLPKTISIQACQTLVYACSGWSIETIEHLGNRDTDYHSLQKALAGFYGTQCGYCSPGMVMTMYGQLKSSGRLTVDQVETSLDGNLCRCTGYRPILDAFKSLASDGSQHLKEKLSDIEDAYKSLCPKTGTACKGSCVEAEHNGCIQNGVNGIPISLPSQLKDDLELRVGEVQWYRPVTVKGIYNALRKSLSQDNVRILVGNTGQGVYKEDGPFTQYISTIGVPDLYAVTIGEPLKLGANVSLTRAIEVFLHMAENYTGYKYLQALADHWKHVANVAVRNIGSWCGNLMLKHAHPGFPSDIFITLLLADAELNIGIASDESTKALNLEQFLKEDMSMKVILSVTLKPANENTQVRTFKITPRAVNSHAYVNAGFRFDLDSNDGFKVIKKPIILFGGINPSFIHASETEEFLVGKRLSDVQSVIDAAKHIGLEVKPDSHYEDASPAYRISLAQTLFYKTVVGFLGDQVSTEIQSARLSMIRPISSSQQVYDMNEEFWPVAKAIPKLESVIQVSGEAEYLNDIPYLPTEAHAALVVTTTANAKIKSVDTSLALSMSGVLGYITAKDIPGKNSFTVQAGMYPDPVFVADRVKYAGQPIGAIVAESYDIAIKAAKLVKVEYDDIKKPILTISEALKTDRVELARSYETGEFLEPITSGDAEGVMKEVKHKIIGELSQGSQFHFCMEPYAARVVPMEDGYDVYSTTQWPNETQSCVAQVLGISAHKINTSVRRIGGGFGGKISRPNILAATAAVAAMKFKRPVRVNLDLYTNMIVAGWREPYLSKFEVGFDDDGKIQAAKIDIISDSGHVRNESSGAIASSFIQNVYTFPNMWIRPMVVTTDTAANTWCRTPGSVETVATIENIIERIAHYLDKDPLQVRESNMTDSREKMPKFENNLFKSTISPLLKEKSMYEQRKAQIQIFNKENRWRKRGLSLMPLLYPHDFPSAFRYGVQVSIYEFDGTVVISHGGIEMGQGLNTKVAQAAAYILGVPMEIISIKPTESVVGANSMVTGGSFGSDMCAHGTKIACEKIRERMNVVKKNMKKQNPTWLEVVKKCHSEDVDLCERYWTCAKEHPKGYIVWAGICLEIEIDVLTGQYLIHRVDLVEDCGRSMNPCVDIGQIEGAFIMGLGLYGSELVKFNPDSGQKLSNGTWEYKIPTALDIPVDMRVTLLPNAAVTAGVMGSKATGEPPLILSYVFVMALREAIAAARAENGDKTWFDMDTPLTVEKIQQLCLLTPEQFQLR